MAVFLLLEALLKEMPKANMSPFKEQLSSYNRILDRCLPWLYNNRQHIDYIP